MTEPTPTARLIARVPERLRRLLPLGLRTALARGADRAATLVGLVTGRPPAARRRRFYDRAGRYASVLAVETENRRVLVPTGDPFIGRPTFAHAQPPERALVDGALALAGAQRGCDVLEVGANVGTTTMLLDERLAPRSLVAVEPAPRNHALLAANVQLNGLADRIRCLRAAISDADGEAELELSPINAGDHRVRVGAAASGTLDEDNWRTVTVPVRSLDSLVAEGAIDPERLGLVWLDVQGHEAHVLRGAEALLEHGVPVVMEIWAYGLARAGGRALLCELIARHFRAFVALPGGTRERPASDLSALIAEVGDRAEDVGDVLLLP